MSGGMSLSVPGSADALGGAQRSGGPVAALSLGEEFGGVRLLMSDLRLIFLLINHGRYSMIQRLFGIGRDQANLLTLVMAMALADGARVKARRVLTGPPLPGAGDLLLAGGSWREVLSYAAGAPANGTPLFGTLLSVAIIGGTAGPAASELAAAIWTSSHRMAMGFHRRYGYIVDPGHWRRRRARRRFDPAGYRDVQLEERSVENPA
jgi:hypothetical protein